MYAESFAKLITELQKLPGIGPKSYFLGFKCYN